MPSAIPEAVGLERFDIKKSRLSQCLKLAAYISIEQSRMAPEGTEKNAQLNKAQQQLELYLTLLKKNGLYDNDARDRLAFLKGRNGPFAEEKARRSTIVPGQSIGAVGSQVVASACCVVRDEQGVPYLVTSN
jgi:hypothetical protein